MEFVTVSPTFERLAISMESNSASHYYRSSLSFGFLKWTCLRNFEGKISVLIFFIWTSRLEHCCKIKLLNELCFRQWCGQHHVTQ